MEFKPIYLQALRENDPKLFNQMVRSGQMDGHLQEKSLEAHRLLAEQLASEPKLANGEPKDQNAARAAEERVLAQMLDFPQRESPDRLEPNDDLYPPTQRSEAQT